MQQTKGEYQMANSSVSRRMESCINEFIRGEFESALIHYFPALDKTAKRRRPNKKVGERIKSFIDDEIGIITFVATKNILLLTNDRITFSKVIYEFARCSIAHEGELDPRINFYNYEGVRIGEIWNLPPTFITGLILAVIIAPENTNEKLFQDYIITIHDTEFNIKELWGKRQRTIDWIEYQFGGPVFNNWP